MTTSAWPLNRSLLPQGKAQMLDNKYGTRVLYFKSYRCPLGRCDICEKDRNDRVGNTGWHFKKPDVITHTMSLIRDADDLTRTEALDHMFLQSPAVVSYTDPCTKPKIKVTYTEGVDYAIDGRSVLWLTGGKQPPKGAEYDITYTALEELDILVLHVLGAQFGNSATAERGNLFRFGDLDNGSIVVSIPVESKAYNVTPGDMFVVADSEMGFDMVVDLEAPQKYTRHKFVTTIEHAFYVQQAPENSVDDFLTTETEIPLTDIKWNKDTRLLEFANPDALYARYVTVTYRARPEYSVYIDNGEFRTPKQGKQPRVVVLIRNEMT